MGSGADDEAVREEDADDITLVENGKEADAYNGLVVIRMRQMDHDADWLGSVADDEVLREEVMDKNVVENGNNEPFAIQRSGCCSHELVGS